MQLEEQIEKLEALGLKLNVGIAVEDFLVSYPRADYEENPFDLTLFAFGIEVEKEPWGRYFCDSVWNFDVECIEDNGSYKAIVENFHRITGRKKKLDELSDRVDLESSEASVKYTIDGLKRELVAVVDDDWADPEIVQTIMEDMKEKGYDFYGKDNGQATVWFYMTPENALALNTLADNVFNIKKKPWWRVW